MKNNAIIEILDDAKFNNILLKKWYHIDGLTLEISKYKTKNIWR